MPKRKPAIVIGTKAELIKMSPVMAALKRSGPGYSSIFTGQHNIDQELKENRLSRPDYVFDPSAKGRGRFLSKAAASIWSVKAFFWIRKALSKLKPSVVLVHGDTMTTAAGALAAKSLGLTLAHIEAGLRSGSVREPFPEEISRRIADKLSDYFFCPTWHSAQNLLAEGKPRSRIFVTGNTNIDAASKKISMSQKKRRGKYLIAKIHRHENVTSRKRLSDFISAISASPLPVVLILPENLERQLAKFGLQVPRNAKTIKYLPQKKFLTLLASATAILTDAGGETEEACWLGVPCIQFRERAERQEAEISGAAIRTTDSKKILEAIVLAKGGKWKIPLEARKAFGTGVAAKEIVGEICKILSEKNTKRNVFIKER
ncbi:MAG: UDP-N-acetylglucosamine 2-epimerase (non-hydrolyzing) [archaeon]